MKDQTNPKPEDGLARHRATQARCSHPTGVFEAFDSRDIERSIVERFERQVLQHPTRLAVKAEISTLTYEELNAAANRIARAVLERTGEGAEPIALLFDHGPSAICALLGVLKAGKFYVSIDPSYPESL